MIAIFVTVYVENRHRRNRWGGAGGRVPGPLLQRGGLPDVAMGCAPAALPNTVESRLITFRERKTPTT